VRDFTWYPRLSADGDGAGLVAHAGTVLLVRTAEKIGLVKGLSQALARWRKPLATHDPGKTVLDLAIAVAAGADCVSDVVVLRDQPGVFGPVASDPTISRPITTLAADAPKALAALASARAAARSAAWNAAGDRAPDHGIDAEHPLIIDLDATLIDSHSEKERAAPTFKKGYGYHPLLAFIDHGSDGTGEPRDGAAVAEITGLIDLTGWPPGMRVIIRRERPHPGAQLRFCDHDGNRLTAFATNTRKGQLADLELRHRHRARCEDRIRTAKDTGLRNLPFRGFDANRIWLAIVALALDLTAWLQTIALHDHRARRWEPKTLRLHLFSIPARIARHARQVHLRLSRAASATSLALTAPATRHLTRRNPPHLPTKGPPRARGTRQPARCTGQPLTPFCGRTGRKRATQPTQASTSPARKIEVKCRRRHPARRRQRHRIRQRYARLKIRCGTLISRVKRYDERDGTIRAQRAPEPSRSPPEFIDKCRRNSCAKPLLVCAFRLDGSLGVQGLDARMLGEPESPALESCSRSFRLPLRPQSDRIHS
jgi:hypothetical protein